MQPASTTSPMVPESPPRSSRGDWTWELVDSFPRQGEWSAEEYLAIDSQRLIEFDRGVLEFLPTPTAGHQLILGFLYGLLSTWCARSNQASPLFAPIPVAVAPNRYRGPDLLLPGRSPRSDDQGIDSPRLVVEILSSGCRSRQRDLVHKRVDYAAAGIPEYWIVDPETETITVLALPSGASEYAVHGEFRPGDTASSHLLKGFNVDVAACFAAAKGASDEPQQGRDGVKE